MHEQGLCHGQEPREYVEKNVDRAVYGDVTMTRWVNERESMEAQGVNDTRAERRGDVMIEDKRRRPMFDTQGNTS